MEKLLFTFDAMVMLRVYRLVPGKLAFVLDTFII